MSTIIRFAQFIWSLTTTPVLHPVISGRKWTLWNERLAYFVRDAVVVKRHLAAQWLGSFGWLGRWCYWHVGAPGKSQWFGASSAGV